MAPQVLEQMAPCSLVSVPISCGAQGKDSDFYDDVHFLIHQMEPACRSILRVS